jgi:hypothetical protein
MILLVPDLTHTSDENSVQNKTCIKSDVPSDEESVGTERFRTLLQQLPDSGHPRFILKCTLTADTVEKLDKLNGGFPW